MKRLLILFFVTSISSVFAQTIDTLPTQKEAFVKGLVDKFEATKKDNLKDLAKDFEKRVESGAFSEAFLEKMMVTTNQMLKMRGKAYPQLQKLTETYLTLSTMDVGVERINNWQEIMLEVMLNSKKGDTKTSLDFMDFSIPLLEKNALYDSKAKSWYLTSDAYSLSYGDRGPVVSAPKTDVVGVTQGDTVNVYKTGGKYYYFETLWESNHGEVDWAKTGLPKNEVYCIFDDYVIDMSKTSYTVDSVFFVYSGYFDKPVNGKLEDKLVANTTPEKAAYPRFSAGKDKLPPQQISENVVYLGGFTLAGSKVLSKSESEKSTLIIYKPNSKEKILTAISDFTAISPEKVTSTNAELSLYFDSDSIFHPSVIVNYNITDNSLRVVKGETTLSQTKFFDSFHNVEFDADVITWNLAEDFIDINTVSTSGIKPAVYESKEFFSVDRMRGIRGNVSYDPLSILNKYAETNEIKTIPADIYAERISPTLTVAQIKPLIFKLVQEGFIRYDEDSEIITINDKVNHYVRSNAKFKDYDNISIRSVTKEQNGRIDLSNNDIRLDGVQSVPISFAAMTEFFPDSGKVAIKKDRDMVFDGLFFCGRLDFFGKENYFKYDSFNMNLPTIDTMIINIPDGDKTDASGNPILRPLNTVMEEMVGEIDINIPINKSGRADLAQFPAYTSKEKSRIYYDGKSIRNGTYSRGTFYYDVDPFVLDSLNHLHPANLSFDGTLYSANIFPEIREPLRVQSDLTLGFHIESPIDGFDIYQGKGKFISDITLNGKGLTGEGLIKYMTTAFESSNIEFYPDSLICTTDTLGIEESQGTYESPWVKSANNHVRWLPYSDSMMVSSETAHPFKMYDDKITLQGNLVITDENITGSGIADWEDAQLISDIFQFQAKQILADTAELRIKSIEGDKVTFNTPNVNAHVDFEENTGFFKSNIEDNPTEFNSNQYITTIDEFFWEIDEKRLEFSVPDGQTDGAPFTSIKAGQDSLSFNATSADYSMVTSIIEAHGVQEILIADSRLIPENGEVIVHPEARMETLNNAVIEASTVTNKHRIENVTATIEGKNKMTASGDYIFQPRAGEAQRIDLTEISVILADSSLISKKNKKNDVEKQYILFGKGDVSQSEKLQVYPNVTFYGDLEFYSSLDNPKVNGFVRIDFQNNYVASDYLEMNTEVDPQNLKMDVSEAKGPGGNLIRTGIFVSKAGIEPIYTNILNNQIGPLDIPLIETSGILEHRYDANEYAFGDEDKLANPDDVRKGNILLFTPEDNDVYAEGSLDFGLEYGPIEDKYAGYVTTNLAENEYSFNTAIAMPLDWDKTVIEKLAYYLYEDNFDMPDINYEDVEIQKQFAEWVDAKNITKMQDEVATSGVFTKPKELKESFVFSGVNMTYNPITRVYKSEGKIGLSFVGDKGVHKKIDGWIELGHRMGADYMNVYLKTSMGDWIYFTYSGINMEIVSSITEINKSIKAIDGNKRKVKGPNNSFYIYALATEYKAKTFLQRMKNGGAPIAPDKQIIDFGGDNNDSGDTIEEPVPINNNLYDGGGFPSDSPFSNDNEEEQSEESIPEENDDSSEDDGE